MISCPNCSNFLDELHYENISMPDDTYIQIGNCDKCGCTFETKYKNKDNSIVYSKAQPADGTIIKE